MENIRIFPTMEINVTQEDIDDIMCSALEGGINYWCRKAEVVGDYLGEYASEQISRGGALKLYDAEEDDVYELNLDKLINGITKAISESYFESYNWYVAGKLDTCYVDAEVADIIIQFALFDNIIYG